MRILLKDILTHLGGIVSVIIACSVLFKKILTKYINTIIESAAQKSIEKLKNQFNKTFSAYELILKKEFEYYEQLGCIYADLIVDILDFKSNVFNEFNFDNEKRLKNIKDYGVKILESIIKLKRDLLLYQAYIPKNIIEKNTAVIIKLQENAYLISDNAKFMQDLQEDMIDKNKTNSFVEDTLMLIADIETSIAFRLQNLSNTTNEN